MPLFTVPDPAEILLQPKSELAEMYVRAFEAPLQLESPAPAIFAMKRLEVEAVVEKKFVEVAEVVVDREMRSKMCVPVQWGEKAWSMVKVGWAPIT